MNTLNLKINKGFSLVEVMLSLAILAIITTFYTTSLIDNEENIFLNTKRNFANNLAKEGVEAIYNIKQNDFNNLKDGNYGISETGNQINLIPDKDIIDNYTRVINISSINNKLKKVNSVVTWQTDNGRNENVSLVTFLTN